MCFDHAQRMIFPPKLLLLRIGWVKATHIAAVAMALVYIVITLGILHREVALRRDCRRKRLALPGHPRYSSSSSRRHGETHQGRKGGSLACPLIPLLRGRVRRPRPHGSRCGISHLAPGKGVFTGD